MGKGFKPQSHKGEGGNFHRGVIFTPLDKTKPQAKYCCIYSHKKRKDSLETRVVLLIFSLELGISGVAVQSIYQNSKKW